LKLSQKREEMLKIRKLAVKSARCDRKNFGARSIVHARLKTYMHSKINWRRAGE
jgi:hypothetical protein